MQYVTNITFPATADTDIEIPVNIYPNDPEDIDYEIVRKNGPGHIYHDYTPSRRKWQPGLVVLRCNIGSVLMDIRFTVRKTSADG